MATSRAPPPHPAAQLWRSVDGSDTSSLRDHILNRFGALIVTIVAVSLSPLALYRIFQIKFGLIGSGCEEAGQLLQVSAPFDDTLHLRTVCRC